MTTKTMPSRAAQDKQSAVECDEVLFSEVAGPAARVDGAVLSDANGVICAPLSTGTSTNSLENPNDDWIRGEVAFVARELRRRNLDVANSNGGSVHPAHGFYVRFGKRAIDLVLSATALVLLSPVNLALALLTYRDVGSPIIFKQDRTGKDLSTFKLIKFRNMTNERDENGELLPPDERITAFGSFVRSHSLDELLNFWSIFKGDMSLIGPRPLPVEFTERMSERHKMRYAVRPGLECPNMLPAPTGVDPAHVRFENDVYYVEHLSFANDIKQALRLVGVVLRRSSSHAYTGTDGHFIGYDHNGEAMSLGRLKDEATYRREVLGETEQ